MFFTKSSLVRACAAAKVNSLHVTELFNDVDTPGLSCSLCGCMFQLEDFGLQNGLVDASTYGFVPISVQIETKQAAVCVMSVDLRKT